MRLPERIKNKQVTSIHVDMNVKIEEFDSQNIEILVP